MSEVTDELRPIAARIRALVLDVDGVLTDGRLHYGSEGEALKVFHVRDGLGIRLLLESGIAVAIITARQGPALARRAEDLGIEHVLSGRRDKLAALHELCELLALQVDQIAYAGDDLLDVPVLRTVGLPITVADGHISAHRVARWVTGHKGGRGAVREIADGLLAAHGDLEAACERLLAATSQ